MTDTLAILGGTPVRSKPFTVEPMVDEDEERMVMEAIRERRFSRYIGSTTDDIEQTLRMTSAEAANLDDEWHFLGGRGVRAFAAEFATAFEVAYAIPISSATTGLGVALAACGVGPGDEVIVPAISFTASASAVLLFNSIPVFVDVDPMSFCIDPEAIEQAVTPRTKAIMPVHLAGNLADMDAVLSLARRHDLAVIEDAAQAIGATWGERKAGTLGQAGVFSFQESKNIMTGEGGMIVTHDAEVARRCRLIGNHGEVVFDDESRAADLANIVGFNFRMPELCAAVGRAQLRKLDLVNAWRTRNAEILRDELRDLPGIDLPPRQSASNGPARDLPHMLVALHDADAMGIDRQTFVAAVRAEGVPMGIGYVRPMYANPTFLTRVAYGAQGCPWTCRRDDAAMPTPPHYEHGQCPQAESLLDRRFLWFYHIAHASTEDDMRDVGRAVRKVVAQRNTLKDLSADHVDDLGERGQGRIGNGLGAGKGHKRKR